MRCITTGVGAFQIDGTDSAEETFQIDDGDNGPSPEFNNLP